LDSGTGEKKVPTLSESRALPAGDEAKNTKYRQTLAWSSYTAKSAFVHATSAMFALLDVLHEAIDRVFVGDPSLMCSRQSAAARTVAADWPRIGRTSIAVLSLFSNSLPSASGCESYAILDEVPDGLSGTNIDDGRSNPAADMKGA
jgi:hypothetical protein